MKWINRLFLVTFIESFATILVERGVYFFTREQLGFGPEQNLWLALAFGVAYLIGAMSSHATCRVMRLEKRVLLAAMVAQIVVQSAMAGWSLTGPVIVLGSLAMGYLNGLKWPVIESYVSAGQTQRAAVSTVGRFNVSWALAVPLALAASGPIIESRFAPALFALAVVINLASLVILTTVAPRPLHLPTDHPDRPSPVELTRYRSLLSSSRWLMLCSYAFMWILAALLPEILASLHQPAARAPALSGLLDVVRVTAFLLLQRFQGWHNRPGPLVAAMIGLPVGFGLVMFGSTLPMVLGGEIVFGLCAGMVYYAALYYAMVVKNASVDAGGAHEGLIGLGFALGPAAALIGVSLQNALHSPVLGTLVGVGPLWLIASLAAMRPVMALRNLRRQQANTPSN